MANAAGSCAGLFCFSLIGSASSQSTFAVELPPAPPALLPVGLAGASALGDYLAAPTFGYATLHRRADKRERRAAHACDRSRQGPSGVELDRRPGMLQL